MNSTKQETAGVTRHLYICRQSKCNKIEYCLLLVATKLPSICLPVRLNISSLTHDRFLRNYVFGIFVTIYHIIPVLAEIEKKIKLRQLIYVKQTKCIRLTLYMTPNHVCHNIVPFRTNSTNSVPVIHREHFFTSDLERLILNAGIFVVRRGIIQEFKA
jgi:hypothetical protein